MISPIRSIETVLVDIPTRRQHRLSFGTITAQNYALVIMTDEDGRIGLGEASTIGGPAWAEESTETIQIMIERYLAPHMIGADPQHLLRYARAMDVWVRGNRFAKAALQMAQLDLAARQLGVPAVQLMGGQVHDSIPLAWTLASGDTDRDIEEGEEKLAQRKHEIFKLKIGYGDPAKDVAHAARIARHFSGRARVQVDVNQAWDEACAVSSIAGLEEAGISLIEQPVARERLDVMQRLAHRFDTLIMADESLSTSADAFALARSAAADVFALKLTKAGGPWATLNTAAVAQAAGIGCYGGCMLETSVGTAAYLHCFSAIPAITHGCELFGPLLLVDDLVTEPLQMSEFSIHLHPGAGFGVDLDLAKLDFYRRDPRRVHIPMNGANHVVPRIHAS